MNGTRTSHSLMVVRRGTRAHDVKYYNDDNGHGLTACGLRVGPGDVTRSGTVTCGSCRRSRGAANREA